MFVDEATASLDAETSFEVLDAILKLDGYTRVIITHDLDKNILRRCTGRFTLKNGTVTEKGAFDNLMEKKGCFYSLFTGAIPVITLPPAFPPPLPARVLPRRGISSSHRKSSQ